MPIFPQTSTKKFCRVALIENEPWGVIPPAHLIGSRAVASRGEDSILFDEVIISGGSTPHNFVGIA